MSTQDEADGAVPEWWPPVSMPRRKRRHRAVLRPVRRLWRRLPRLGKISLSTLVIGSLVLLVPVAVLGMVTSSPPEGSTPTGDSVYTFSVVQTIGLPAPPYSPPVPITVLPAVSPASATPAPGVYADGMRQLGSLSFGPGRLSSSLTFSTANGPLSLTATGGCSDAVPAGITLRVLLTINGHTADQETCTANGAQGVALPASVNDPDADFSALGVQPGRTSIAAVTVQVTPARAAVPVGSFAFLERVPPSDYPTPPRPANLTLPPAGNNPIVIDSRTVGVNGSWLVKANPGESLEIRTAAPGDVTISCGGDALRDDRGYDWSTRSAAVQLADGVTGTACSSGGHTQFEVSASGFSAPGWYVESKQGTDPVPVTTTYQVCSASCTPSNAVTYPSAPPA